MKTLKLFATAAVSALALATAILPASADIPGRHPFYRHALADLRFAHNLLARNSYVPGVDGEEDVAISDINQAYSAIKTAGIDDGKAVDSPVPVDGGLSHAGRLNRALRALDEAHHDLDREEQNPNARGARDAGVRAIDSAMQAIRHAHYFSATGI